MYKRYACIVLLVLFIALSLNSVCGLHPAQDIPFIATKDTHITNVNPSTNYGSSTSMSLLSTLLLLKSYVLVGFNLDRPACNASLPAKSDPCYTQGFDTNISQLAQVTLKLTLTSSVTGKVSIYSFSDFNEYTATWSNTYTGSAVFITDITLSSDNVIEADVTEAVQNGARFFLLKTPSLLFSANINSREVGTEANRPTLIVHRYAVELEEPNTYCTQHDEILEETIIDYTKCPYTGSDPDPPTCLFVHGAPSNKLMWRNIPQYIQHACKVYMITLPGSGYSGDVVLNGSTPYINKIINYTVEFIEILDLDRIVCIGQDFGDAVCRGMENIISPSKIERIVSMEGVMIRHVTCSPASEALGLCYQEGSAPLSSFLQTCFIADENLISSGDDDDRCGTYLLSRNWFYNESLSADPNVLDQASLPSIVSGTLMIPGTAPILFSFPPSIRPNSDDVIQVLSYDLQPPSLMSSKYLKDYLLTNVRQSLQYWPRHLAQHNLPNNIHSQAYVDITLQTIANYQPLGSLAHIPKHYWWVYPGHLRPVAGDDVWANTNIPNMDCRAISVGAIHFFMEDGQGAQDFGLRLAKVLLE